MGFAERIMAKPGKGVDPNAPKKTGAALFFEIFWREFWEILKLNMLFLLFCLPIVTIPAAITAMSGITLLMVRDENHFLFQDFWRVFKREFGRSLGAGWIVLLGLAATGFGVFFYSGMEDMGWFRLVPAALGGVGFLILYCMSFYVFVQLAMLNAPVKAILKNAFYLTFVCMKRNLLLLVITAPLLLLGFGLLPYSVPAVAMLVFAFNSLAISFCAYPSMQKYLFLKEEKAADLPAEESNDGDDWKSERKRLGKDDAAG